MARCIEEGLVSGQRLAADASLIQADANRQNSAPQSEWEPDKIDPSDAPPPLGNIWKHWMMKPSAQPVRWSQSSLPIPIPHRSGLEHAAVLPILSIPQTI